MWPRLVNASGFQLVWLCCVGGAGAGFDWLGPLAAALFVAGTLAFAGNARNDLYCLLLAIPLGLLLDSAFAYSGLLNFASAPGEYLVPAWIGGLWAAFALTLNHSLAFLQGRPGLAAALAALCAPLSYLAAARTFGAVQLPQDPLPALLMLAASWALLLPALLALPRMALHRQHKEFVR